MKLYLFNLWRTLRASFWLLPALMVVLTILLSILTLRLDHTLEKIDLSGDFTIIWEGDAQSAELLLSTIAGSVITLTGVVFSITIVTLSLASAHYGSRILRNFMLDIGMQMVLGVFISTSLYCLLILKKVNGDEPHQAFIPNLSITISILFGILTLGMLIYFIHHVAVMVQFSKIVSKLGNDLFKMIAKRYPDQINETEIVENQLNISEFEYSFSIPAPIVGYLQAVDYCKLLKIAEQENFIIHILYRSGNFIIQNSDLVKIYSSQPSFNTKLKTIIQKAFIIGFERNPTQDLEFAVDQLVGIALRMLSFNVNDTLSANACIDHLGAALCLICKRKLYPSYWYDQNKQLRLISKQMTFSGLADAAFNQIRQYGSQSATVIIHLLEIFRHIVIFAQTNEQIMAIRKHIYMVKSVGEKLPNQNDRLDVEDRFQAILALNKI